jgi:hypothetical protein
MRVVLVDDECLLVRAVGLIPVEQSARIAALARVAALVWASGPWSCIISRTSWAHRQDSAILAAQASASSCEATSMIEKPPTTALVSGRGPSATDPSVDTMLAC